MAQMGSDVKMGASLALTVFCRHVGLLTPLSHVRLDLPLLEALVIAGPVILDDQALPNQKLQGLMPHKKVLHFLLIALLLFYALG